MNRIAPVAEPRIREIPLSRLALAPENVRKTPPDAQADAALKASVAAIDVLENLVVRVDGPVEDGRYAVVAGGRRLKAMQELAADGVIGADHPVPCQVRSGDVEPGEISLAENVIRIAMHPADQVVAFSKLVQAGQSVSAIAARFGTSERVVEQRLRLGNAAPELLDAYREDRIDLEVLKAFAVTTDRERQMAVWERVSGQGYRPSAAQVKRLLTEERVPGRTAIARFVGVDAYEAAGGQVLRDLFAPRRRERRLVRGPGAAGEARHRQAPGGRRRAGDPLEVGRPHDRRRMERHRPPRPHRAAAGRAHAGGGGGDRQTGSPPGRTRGDRRRRVDPGDGGGSRIHRDPARRDRGRHRGPRGLPPRGSRDGRLHRHHRPGRRIPGHLRAGQARGHAEADRGRQRRL